MHSNERMNNFTQLKVKYLLIVDTFEGPQETTWKVAWWVNTLRAHDLT